MSRFTQLLKEPAAPIHAPVPVTIKTAPVVKKEAAAQPQKGRTFSTRLRVHKKFLEEVELSALEALPDGRMRA